jgi:hypothetical protein
MKTISRAEFNSLTKGIVVPTKKVAKSVDTEDVKRKAIESWKNFGIKVKVENEDGSTFEATQYPYKTLSFKELGQVKVVWTNKEGQQEKEYNAIEWDNGRKAVFMGWCYKGIVPLPNNEGLYMFG